MKHHYVNGSTTELAEHGGATRTRLRRLLEQHEHMAASLRMALELLDADIVKKKSKPVGPRHLPPALTQALDQEATRHSTGPSTKEGRHAVRQRTAKVLASFDTTTPQPTSGRHIGILITRGYLKRKGDGYVRTSKEYTP